VASTNLIQLGSKVAGAYFALMSFALMLFAQMSLRANVNQPIMLSVAIKPNMLSVAIKTIMLNVVMPNEIMLSVIILNVAAPFIHRSTERSIPGSPTGSKPVQDEFVYGNTARSLIRGQCYKTFFVCNVRIFGISYSVCPW
jgi:hypothetical protein